MKLEQPQKEKLKNALINYFKDWEGDFNIKASNVADDLLIIIEEALRE